MNNSNDYIKRSTMLDYINKHMEALPESSYSYPLYQTIKLFVEDIPFTDVIEIVRCKICKHSKPHSEYTVKCYLEEDIKIKDDFDFCSCGVKRE